MSAEPVSPRPPSERSPVFLARRAYFRRRVIDGARLLPVLGAGLFVMPLLWKPAGDEGRIGTVEVMFFVFLCWLTLVVTAFFLSRRMIDRAADAPPPGETETEVTMVDPSDRGA